MSRWKPKPVRHHARPVRGAPDSPEARLRALIEAIRVTIGECMTVRLPGATSVHLGVVAQREDAMVVGGMFDLRTMLDDIDTLISDVAPPFTDEEVREMMKRHRANKEE